MIASIPVISNPSQKKKYATPEDIPVGMMAEMLILQNKKNQILEAELIPYTPLDPTQTPQTAPIMPQQLFDQFKQKITSFYKYMEEIKHAEKKALKRKQKQDLKEKEEMEIQKQLEKIDSQRKRNIQQEVEELYDKNNITTNEMGVTKDGQSFKSFGERAGLGASQSTALKESEMFAAYRKQRSYQYHVTAEERTSIRDTIQLCFICQQPGHKARDCKFGLT